MDGDVAPAQTGLAPDPELLVLAALTYRGWADPSLGAVHDVVLRDELARGHAQVAGIVGPWRLAWGPASYRLLGMPPDDVYLCVWRHAEAPERVVVSVRGTNPSSGIDWLLGDFWVGTAVPWPFDPHGTAALTASTALGLSVLRHLRAIRPDAQAYPHAWTFLDGDVTAQLRNAAAAVLRPGRALLAPRLRALRVQLSAERTTLRELANTLRGHAITTRVELLRAAWRARIALRIAAVVDAAATAVGDPIAFDLLRLLEGGTTLRAALGTGPRLVELLHAFGATTRQPLDVTVVGHSKGGAMAVALAAWLAETQGKTAPLADRWDPDGAATVRCATFAAPTPGNTAFATRVEELLGVRCVRVWNPHDVVTQAWTPAGIRGIPDLYDDAVIPVAGLQTLAEIVAAAVAGLGYAHAGRSVPADGLPTAVDYERPLFVDQIVHQHLEAYLRAVGLPPEVTTKTFFGPLL